MMFSNQQMVIGWIELAVAGTILLALTKVAADRLRQPVDRVNLITLSLVVSAAVPLMLIFLSAPSIRLELLPAVPGQAISAQATAGRAATAQAQSSLPIPLQEAANDDATNLRSKKPALSDTGETHGHDSLARATMSTTLADSSSTNPSVKEVSASRTSDATRSWLSSWSIAAEILVLSHVLAIAWFSLQWIAGRWRLRQISRSTFAPNQAVATIWKQVTQGNDSHVRLLVTNEIAAPMVFNWRRPVVLIPESIATGDQAVLRFCLAHEWSHVCYGDLSRWQLINLCQLFFWYQPLFWILRRELRICQDLVADDQAAGRIDDQLARIEYSELLMSIAKGSASHKISGAMAFYERSSQLSRRIKILLTNPQTLRSQSSRMFYWVSGIAMLMISFLVGSVRLGTVQAQEGAHDKPAETQTDAKVPTGGKTKIVRGQVIDQAGQPVPGAKLWLPLTWEPRRTVQATADQAGKFELTCPAEWINPSLTGSFWTLWAFAPGHSIQSQSVFEVVRGASEKVYTIQLPAASQSRFVIVAPDGKPLAKVLVGPQNYKTSVAYEAVPEEMQAFVSASSDESGRVTLPALQMGPLFTIEMRHAEFGRQIIRVDDRRPGTEREIRLRPNASIKGRITGANPDWIRNVKMAFITDNRDQWKEPQGIAEVVTDSEGNFQVPIIASGGPLQSYIRIDPALPVRPVLSEDVYLIAGEQFELEIPLVAATLVRGKVVAKSTGKPVAHAEASIGYGGHHQSEQITTDADGKYEARVLPGAVRIQVVSLPDNLVQVGAPWAEPIQVPKDVDNFELPTIEVVGTHEIAGQLVGVKDQPLPNVQLFAIHGNRRYGFGTSDAEGRFKLRVPDGIETKIEVYVEGRGSMPVQVIQREPLVVRYTADASEKEMEAKRSGKADVAVSGRVLFSGKPLAGVQVTLNRGTPVSLGSNESGTRYSQVSEMKTDALGSYRLSGLKVGDEYQLDIKPPFPAADPEWHHQSPYIHRLPKDAKSEVVLPDVKLRKLSQSIAGMVVDPDGKPVKGAAVSAQLRNGASLTRPQSGPPPWTQSDYQGRFQLKELPDEPLAIMAYMPNPKGGRIRSPAKLNVDQNQQDVRIVLDPSLQDEEER